MKVLYVRQDCPQGFNFYSCGNGFRGCCGVEPCNPGSTCPEEERAAGSSTIRSTPPTTTTRSPPPPTTTRVTLTTPPPSRTSSDTDPTSSTTLPSTASSSASTTTSSSASTTSPTTTSATATSTSASQPENETPAQVDGRKPNTGLIAGSTVGGVVVLIILIILLSCVLIRRRKKANAMHQATLHRRQSMQPMETADKQGIFAPFGGFYRGVKTFYETPDTSRTVTNNDKAPTVEDDPLTPEKRKYHIVNADPSPLSSPASPRFPSTIPSMNSDPIHLDSRSLHPLIEMPDTSPSTTSRHSFNGRWGIPPQQLHADSPTLGVLGPTVYKPYRPASSSTAKSTPPLQHPASLSPGMGMGMGTHQRSSSGSAWVEIQNDTGSASKERSSSEARQHVMSWNEHTAAAALSPPTSLSPTMESNTCVSPIEPIGQDSKLGHEEGKGKGKRESADAEGLWGRK
ncbi:hypothetical protein BDZ85DRAFT_293535 [Elsinoe ampelina]|uniref:Uncharacterized protein n=1 Tax=Elsinoe ampelina TaxID=302913 RepID=A0A6A6GLK8_9PEZI|nr:hypothetical protein BDZ85DRAFT_293535 [Elsinoe ampelina]